VLRIDRERDRLPSREGVHAGETDDDATVISGGAQMRQGFVPEPLDVLDAEVQRAVGVLGASLRTSGRMPIVTTPSPAGSSRARRAGASASVPPATATPTWPLGSWTRRPGNRFMGGLPRKPATKAFTGRS